MFFDKKITIVEKKIVEHLLIVKNVLNIFIKALNIYVNEGNNNLDEYRIKIRKEESKADDLRREIGNMFYSGAFLSMFRQDFWKLTRATDNIANIIQDTVGEIVVFPVEIPKDLKPKLS